MLQKGVEEEKKRLGFVALSGSRKGGTQEETCKPNVARLCRIRMGSKWPEYNRIIDQPQLRGLISHPHPRMAPARQKTQIWAHPENYGLERKTTSPFLIYDSKFPLYDHRGQNFLFMIID